MGARVSYLYLNAIFVAIIGFFNLTALIMQAAPIVCTVGFLMYIGLIVTAQGFERDPDASANHGVAVAMGLVRGTESVHPYSAVMISRNGERTPL
jgi:hypothetical protein